MGNDIGINHAVTEVRKDFIHPDSYLSRDFARLEKDKLWTEVWQWACRLEDIPKVGNYEVYDIADQSVIVVRTSETEVKAFHNVCPHRGRRLLSGSGKVNKFHCIFHAWQWDLNGNNTRVLDQEQWEGCPGMSSEELKLVEVHVAEWAGFVFINMSAEPQPFEEFIAPAPECFAPLAMEKMHKAWHVVIDVECNWKVAQEAFMESYHVWGTHPQLLPYIDEANFSEPKGLHGRHVYLTELPPGVPSRRVKQNAQMSLDEIRTGFSNFIHALGTQLSRNDDLNGQLTARSVNAAVEALAAMPSDTGVEEFIGGAVMAMKAAADADDAYYPLMTAEQHQEMGEDWNIFPTLSIVPSFDGTLIFRARPRGDDPSKATIEMISLLHWGKGKEPKVEKEYVTDWRKQHKGVIPPLLLQDLINMEDVQKGSKSIALKAIRPNPVQERQISHFHAVLGQYLFDIPAEV